MIQSTFQRIAAENASLRRLSGSPNDRRISPAVGEWAILECARLREVNAELLAALQEMIVGISEGNIGTARIQTAIAAIAKATQP